MRDLPSIVVVFVVALGREHAAPSDVDPDRAHHPALPAERDSPGPAVLDRPRPSAWLEAGDRGRDLCPEPSRIE
jgi:hypothetical protein